MRRILLKRSIVSLILVVIVLLQVVMSSPEEITLNETQKYSTISPWPTCATVPTYRIRCNWLGDPFTTTTTWHSRTPHPEK